MSSRPDGDMGAASAAPFDPYTSSWRLYELTEGESVAGEVVRLPERAAFNGSRLFLRTGPGEVLAIRATSKSGHTALENKLKRLDVRVGDQVRVTFQGWGETSGEGFPYRAEEVTRVGG